MSTIQKEVSKNNQNENNTEEGENKKPKYTDDDLKKHSSKAAQSAVEDYIKNKQPQAIEDAVNKALAEKEEEQRLSAEELAKKKTADKEKSLNDREAKLNMREQRNLAVSILEKNGLSADFADNLIGKDDNDTQNKVEGYIKSVKFNVDKKINEYAKGGQPPKAGVDKLNQSTDTKAFNDMSFSEKIKLHRENPAKYEELKKGAK